MNRLIFSTAVLALGLVPSSAQAIFTCEASLDRDNFVDERKNVQNQLQKSILEYRNLEAQRDQTDATKKQLADVKARIDKEKKTFQDLDSKYFPRTPVTAFGSACNDKRWVEEAKAKLVEKPEHLGKHWYVWLDKATRQPKAGLERPPFETMAE